MSWRADDGLKAGQGSLACEVKRVRRLKPLRTLRSARIVALPSDLDARAFSSLCTCLPRVQGHQITMAPLDGERQHRAALAALVSSDFPAGHGHGRIMALLAATRFGMPRGDERDEVPSPRLLCSLQPPSPCGTVNLATCSRADAVAGLVDTQRDNTSTPLRPSREAACSKTANDVHSGKWRSDRRCLASFRWPTPLNVTTLAVVIGTDRSLQALGAKLTGLSGWRDERNRVLKPYTSTPAWRHRGRVSSQHVGTRMSGRQEPVIHTARGRRMSAQQRWRMGGKDQLCATNHLLESLRSSRPAVCGAGVCRYSNSFHRLIACRSETSNSSRACRLHSELVPVLKILRF